jgi:hypothetical protein
MQHSTQQQQQQQATKQSRRQDIMLMLDQSSMKSTVLCKLATAVESTKYGVCSSL